ncbi:HAD-IB family hydrolase [bacterium]|nr:HAD-IB family hydrolase [bacterium]
MKGRNDLALFDFDGTITTKDTLIDLLYHLKGPFHFWWGIIKLSPFIILFLLKKMPNYRMKERFLTAYLGGMSVTEFDKYAEEYTNKRLPHILRTRVVERIAWHKNRGDRVILVSASLSLWLHHFTEKQGIELIATEATIENGIITGTLLGKNCYGPEKVARVQKIIKKEDYDQIWAYGDSRGDKEMLTMADHSFFKVYHF